jgi:hypothetical protein
LSAPVFCPRCGFANIQGHRFCTNCGAPLVVPPPVAYAPPAAAPPAYGYPPPAPPAYMPPAVPPAGSPPPAYAPPGYWWPPAARATAGSMIGDTVRVWAKRFFEFFEMFLIFGLINAAIAFSISYALTGITTVGTGFGLPSVGTATTSLELLLLALAAIGVVGAVISALFTGAASYMAVHAHRNTAVDLRTSLSEGAKHLLSVLGATVLVDLIVLGLFLLPFAVILAGLVVFNPVVIGIGFLVFIIAIPFVIFLVLSFALYAPVIMVESSHAVESLRRSWKYMRGRRLSLFGAGIVIWILYAAIELGFIIAAGVFALSRDPILIVAGTYATTVLGTAIAGSLLIILGAVTYSLIRADEDTKRQYPGYYGTAGPPPAPAASAPPTSASSSSLPPLNPPPPPAGP